MAGESHGTLETRYYNNAYLRLRSFDKTINFNATCYYANTGGWGSATAYGNRRFEYVNAGQGTYSTADLPNNIGDNAKVFASEVQNFATNCISRTVNQIEGRLTNSYFDWRICHSSCHYSCHGSRGRR